MDTLFTEVREYEAPLIISPQELDGIPNLYDSAGNCLTLCGILTSEAKFYVHVCFDDHPELGQRMHWYSVDRARRLAMYDIRRGKPFSRGSKEGSSFQNTSAGFNYLLSELEAVSLLLTTEDLLDTGGTCAERAVRCYKRWLHEQGGRARPATLNEQKRQIDFMRLTADGNDKYGVEIKSRNTHQRKWGRLFVQTHESNPNREYR